MSPPAAGERARRHHKLVGGLPNFARRIHVSDGSRMIGEALGNYTITAKLGSGAMGVVFRAEHVRIARTAAIKVLIPELAENATAVQRFFNEARATSSIRHPGIVDVFDCAWMRRAARTS